MKGRYYTTWLGPEWDQEIIRFFFSLVESSSVFLSRARLKCVLALKDKASWIIDAEPYIEFFYLWLRVQHTALLR